MRGGDGIGIKGGRSRESEAFHEPVVLVRGRKAPLVVLSFPSLHCIALCRPLVEGGQGLGHSLPLLLPIQLECLDEKARLLSSFHIQVHDELDHHAKDYNPPPFSSPRPSLLFCILASP